jgi:hypothetical protein
VTHLLKSIDQGKTATAKCGEEFKTGPYGRIHGLPISGWASDVDCRTCIPSRGLKLW